MHDRPLTIQAPSVTVQSAQANDFRLKREKGLKADESEGLERV
jgi:hypothetical protein